MYDDLHLPVGSAADQPSETTPGVSEKKLRANRENAKKSTGPRTSRGRSYSRRNAIKHGLFSKHIEDSAKSEYEILLKSSWQQYQPIGRAEELEVERITVCWMRLVLAWRYEQFARHTPSDGTPRQSPFVEAICKRATEEAASTRRELVSLTDQVKRYGVFPELRERFSEIVGSTNLWDRFQLDATSILEEMEFPKYAATQDVTFEASQWRTRKIPFSQDYERALAILTLTQANIHFDRIDLFTKILLGKVTTDAELPDSEALDLILRYEAATERSLQRATDRLERLQRRRKGERDLPLVRVHLTE